MITRAQEADLRQLGYPQWVINRMKPEDAPVSPEHILAPAGAPTKIRTDKTAALIWLQVDEKGKREPRGTWIGFNAVVDVALLSGRSK
jgi:hypothetical protein